MYSSSNLGIHDHEIIHTHYFDSLAIFCKNYHKNWQNSISPILLMGIMDTMAAFCFAMAASKGMLSQVAVISSLYPAVTIILSAVITGERIQKIQFSGVVLAIAGVTLISAF